MRPEDDAVIAELALRRGVLTRAKLERALEIRTAAAAVDIEQHLLDILTTKGLITAREARDLEEEIAVEDLTRRERQRAIEGYAVQGFVERWGMGAVFRATQLSMQRPVALRILSRRMAGEPRFLDRFLLEARTAGLVSHPNLVGALDMGHSHGFYYYALEWPDAHTLRQTVRGGPLGPARLLLIARQIAGALAHLQSLGLTHRDIQPTHVLLLSDGTARLSHVGCARAPDDPSLAETGIPIGTPGYTAPELLTKAPSADIRSDLYSLGATLYYAATARRPIGSPGGPPATPAGQHADLPQGVSALLMRLMAGDPSARFQTPEELIEAIERLRNPLAEEPSRAGRIPAALPDILVIDEAEGPPGDSAAAGEGTGQSLDAPAPADVPKAAEAVAAIFHAAPSGRRRAARIAWAAAIVLLLAALAGTGVWAVRRPWSRRAATTAPTNERPAGMPGVAEKREPVSEPPAFPPGRAEAAATQEAVRLAEDALAYDKANPDQHAEALLRLRRALLAADDLPQSGRLRARLVTRQQLLSGLASNAYAELAQQLTTLKSQERYGGAFQALAAFPEALRYGAWQDLLDARWADLGEDAERRYLTLAAKGAAALLRQRYDEGVAAYKAMAELGIPWIARAAEALEGAAASYAENEGARLKEDRARQAVLDRRRAFGELTRNFSAIQEEVKKRDYVKALALCRAVPEALRDGDRGKAVAHLEERLALLAELWADILKGPPGAIGKPFSLHGTDWVVEGFAGSGPNSLLVLKTRTDTGERTLRQPLSRLPGLQLGALAEWATAKDAAAAAALKVGILYLTEGEAARARQKFQEAGKEGAAVAPYLDDLEADILIGGALAGHRQGQWAEARKLLETTLDRFGATPPVILSHATLSGALKECLAKLGEPRGESPAAFAPAALPERLRTLLLLPATWVSPSPPANPLDGHFATPLRRGNPVRLGADDWSDYSVSVRWSAEPPCRLVLGARVAEPRRGQFAFYYAAVGGGRLAIGRRDDEGDTPLASKPLAAAPAGQKQRLTFTLIGPSLSVELHDGTTLEVTDAALTAGRIAIEAPDAPILVSEVIVAPSAPRRAASP